MCIRDRGGADRGRMGGVLFAESLTMAIGLAPDLTVKSGGSGDGGQGRRGVVDGGEGWVKVKGGGGLLAKSLTIR